MDIVSFLETQGLAVPRVRIVDVGAMMLDANPWEALVERGVAEVLGFEPQAAECAKLQAHATGNRRYLPYALGDGGRWPFHHCRAPMTSSVFRPNLELVTRFQNLADLMQVVATGEIETRRLDDIPEAHGADLLKLDVQGFELKILEHAQAVLEQTGLVQAEVCFVELYEHQPLFADVDRHLRARGFMLHTLLGIGSRAYKPLVLSGDLNRGLNQFLWADAVYVRSLDRWSSLGPEALLRLFLLLHGVYRSADLAYLALQHYDRAGGTRLAAAYLAGLTGRTQAA